MRKYSILSFFLGLAIMGHSQVPALQLRSIPDVVQFGTRTQHQVLHSTVVLKNTGPTNISIVGIQTDCGCAVGTLKRKTIGPNEQTDLDISMETRDYRGPVIRKITLTLDNGQMLQIPVQVQVNPYGNWKIDPAIVNFGTIKAEDETELSFTVTPHSTYRLTSATPSLGWIHVRFVQEGDSYRVFIKKNKGTPAGTFQNAVFLETTDPEVKSLEIPVLATVKGDLTIIPNPVTMGTTRLGQKRSVIVTIDDWKYSDIPTLVIPHGSVTFLEQEGTRYRFEVAITPDTVGLLQRPLHVLRPKHSDTEGVEARIVETVPVIMRVLPVN